ncbi:MAG: hypothetical protein M9897_11150 [Brumimicrobium sp.]|nr:hypothetical protein [Brumimicrobium sp.]
MPGGGAGSLNDWRPSYSDKIKNAWYSELYDILRYLFDNNLQAEHINEVKSIRLNNNIEVIRCLNCNKSYQHPKKFESHIALDFYRKNFIELAEKGMLLNLFIPELTYENQKVKDYRNWLNEQYQVNNIKIYDFVNNKYICPHCGKDHGETEHDLFLVENERIDKMEFQRIKLNADWEDFERIPADNRKKWQE